MNTLVKSSVVLASFVLFATGASAQQVGHYAGTTSQGQRFEFTIADDGAGGLALTDVSLDVSVTCAASGNVLVSGIGVGTFVPFTGNQVQTTFAFNTLYEPVTIKFRPNGTAGGSISVAYPAYSNVSVNRKTENCASGKLTVSASPVAADGFMRQTARPAAGVTMVPLN